MKHKILILLVAVLAFSCAEEKVQISTFSGKIENKANDTINLIGSDFEKKIVISEEGTFTTELTLPYNGYYNAVFGRIPVSLYLEQGKSLILNLDIEDVKNSLAFEGDLGLENKFLVDKREVGSPKDMREFYKLEADDFLTGISDINEKLNTALTETGITNTEFINSQKDEFLYQEASFLNSYKGNHAYLTEAQEEIILPDNFFTSIEKINLTDTLKYRTSSGYQRVVQGHLNKLVSELPEDDSKNRIIKYIEVVNQNFPPSFAKNQLLKSTMGYELKPDKHLDEVYKLFMANQTDEKLIEAMEENYTALNKLTPGNVSAGFDFENFKGGTTSLESLKGNYVYVDVWATWCGPCLAEAPYFKEIVKDYAGKNIEFVAISIDSDKDYDKWRNMISTENLAGTHLYAGGSAASETDFIKAYRVNAIPRFILIDTEGNIFDADTFRPSEKKLRDLFDEILE